MFGWKLVREAELKLTSDLCEERQTTVRSELNVAKAQIERLESQLLKTELKYEEALERSDRQLDGILAQTGLPEVTATTKRDHDKKEQKTLDQEDKHRNELNEMFGESLEELERYDHLGLPSELQEEAAKLIAGKL